MGSLPRLAPVTLWLWSGVAAAEVTTGAAPGTSSLHGVALQTIEGLLLVALLVVGYSVIERRRQGGMPGFWPWLSMPLLLIALVLGLEHAPSGFPAPHELAGDDALEVRVTAHQGWWEYEYGGDVRVTSFAGARPRRAGGNHLLLPAGRPVRLLETSADGVHPFRVPELGIQTEAMPGYFTETRITPEREGLFHGPCPGCAATSPEQVVVEVVSATRFDAWLERRRGRDGVAR